MVRAAKGHKAPEWEEIAAVGCAVQVLLPSKYYCDLKNALCSTFTFTLAVQALLTHSLNVFSNRFQCHNYPLTRVPVSQQST